MTIVFKAFHISKLFNRIVINFYISNTFFYFSIIVIAYRKVLCRNPQVSFTVIIEEDYLLSICYSPPGIACVSTINLQLSVESVHSKSE